MRYLLIALLLTACTPPERPFVWRVSMLQAAPAPEPRERCCPEWTPQPTPKGGYDP